MRWLPVVLLLAGCFNWKDALSICLDAGGACTLPGSGAGGGGAGGGDPAVDAKLVLVDGGAMLDLGDIELGVPQPLLLRNAGPMAVSGLAVTATGLFDAGAACTTLDVDASCALLLTGQVPGRTLFTVVTARFSGGVPSVFSAQANVFGRLVLSSSPDGSGAWSLADGGAVLSDGGACLDACEERFFTPAVDVQAAPLSGCYCDGGFEHVTFSSSPQTRGFRATCYDLAFLFANPGAYGAMAPAFSDCARAARAAGLPYADEYEVLLYNHPVTGNGWQRADGVPYAGPQSFAPIFVMVDGGPNDVDAVWFGAAGNDCAGWMNSGVMNGFMVDPADEVLNAGGNALCAVARPLRCFGSHWKKGAPPMPAVPAGARRAFLSESLFHPGAGGVGAADQLCSNEAADAGLPRAGQFMAYLSTSGAEAGARFNLDGGNWYRVDDAPLLFDPVSLASTSAATFRVPLAKTAHNTVPPTAAAEVWVGDTAMINCTNWTSASSSQLGFLGRFTSAANHAVRDPAMTSTPCNQGERLYCLEN